MICPDCDGDGTVTVNPTCPRDPQFDVDVRCRRCGGDGEIEPAECGDCGGLFDEVDGDGLCDGCATDAAKPEIPVTADDFANPRPPDYSPEDLPF